MQASRRIEAKGWEVTDRAILATRLAGTAPHEIAETVGIQRSQLDGRFAAILAELAGRARRDAVSARHRAHVA
jgi:hypothetical protein